MGMNRFPFFPQPAIASLLTFCLASSALLAGDEKKQQAGELPEELRGAKIYKLPQEGEKGALEGSPVLYRKLAYKDINLERLVLDMWVGIKPFNKSVTISRIYFQDVRANGIPVHVEPFAKEFKTSKKEEVDLPAPLQCTITFSDLESLLPIQTLIDSDKIAITGESFIEVKLGTLQKIAVRAKRLVIPVPLEEELVEGAAPNR